MKRKLWLTAAATLTIAASACSLSYAGGGGAKHEHVYDPDKMATKRINELEAVLGKALTDDQKLGIKQAIEAQHTSNEDAHTKENQAIATALNVNVTDVQTKLNAGHKKGEARPKTASDFATHVGEAMGVTLTDAQKLAIEQAYNTEQGDIKTSNKQLDEDEAKALGLTPKELKAKEREYRQEHPRAGHHPK